MVTHLVSAREQIDGAFRRDGFRRPSLLDVVDLVFPVIRDTVDLEGVLFVHEFAREVGNLFEADSGLLEGLKFHGRKDGPSYGVHLVRLGSVLHGLYGSSDFQKGGFEYSSPMHLFYTSPDALTDYVKARTLRLPEERGGFVLWTGLRSK